MSNPNDTHDPNEAPPPSPGLRALLLVCFAIIVIVSLAYLPTLVDDNQRTAYLFGVLCVFNSVMLVMNVQRVEASNTSWRKIEDDKVSAVISTLGNVLFIGGLALWFAYKSFGISNALCYFVAFLGVGAHSALHLARWRIKNNNLDAILTTVYSVLASVIATAIIVALFFKDVEPF